MAKDFQNFAKVVKFCQVWSHWSHTCKQKKVFVHLLFPFHKRSWCIYFLSPRSMTFKWNKTTKKRRFRRSSNRFFLESLNLLFEVIHSGKWQGIVCPRSRSENSKTPSACSIRIMTEWSGLRNSEQSSDTSDKIRQRPSFRYAKVFHTFWSNECKKNICQSLLDVIMCHNGNWITLSNWTEGCKSTRYICTITLRSWSRHSPGQSC